MAVKSVGVDVGQSQQANANGVHDAFAIPKIMTQRRKRQEAAKARVAHCVYFIELQSGGLIKIGRTKCLSRRMSDIASSLGLNQDDVRVVGYIGLSQGNSVLLETALHRHFGKRRVEGEWFNIRDKNLLHEVIAVADVSIGKDYSIKGLAHDETYDIYSEKWNLTKRQAKLLTGRQPRR